MAKPRFEQPVGWVSSKHFEYAFLQLDQDGLEKMAIWTTALDKEFQKVIRKFPGHVYAMVSLFNDSLIVYLFDGTTVHKADKKRSYPTKLQSSYTLLRFDNTLVNTSPEVVEPGEVIHSLICQLYPDETAQRMYTAHELAEISKIRNISAEPLQMAMAV